MSAYKVISNDLPGFVGTAWLVEVDGEFYAASSITTPRVETILFPSDEVGNIDFMRIIAEGLNPDDFTYEMGIEDAIEAFVAQS